MDVAAARRRTSRRGRSSTSTPAPRPPFDDVLVLARLYRTALEHLGVVGMPKVTGKRGIQIWVPDRRRATPSTRPGRGSRRCRGRSATPCPSWSAGSGTKTDREGLARLDYTQNAINKTLVAPFSARPAPGAPVSVPIEWDELDDPDLRPDRWTIRTVLDRLERGDPLAPLIGRPQRCQPVLGPVTDSGDWAVLWHQFGGEAHSPNR